MVKYEEELQFSFWFWAVWKSRAVEGGGAVIEHGEGNEGPPMPPVINVIQI